MKILVACEESQEVTKAFRELGHEAFSCDLYPCSGGHPEWHTQGDVTELLAQDWDMIIAHPPCTYMANSGVQHLHKDPTRWDKLDQATEFFRLFLDHPCPRIAIENPIPHKYAVERIGGRKYSQIVQPYQFGHTESKRTCFWLKGLPKLKETDNVKHIYDTLPKNKQQRLFYLPPSKERAKLRSKTFPGIAKAMAEQWGI
jgi:hypothetical protein